MKLSTYPFTKSTENYYYEFYSEGPKGRIRKVVEYFRLREFKEEVFNLAFGDWDEKEKRINTITLSNNADRDKVLATVGATVSDFMKDHPDAIIIAVGSTTSRTRTYQMSIAKLWDEINQVFEIQGYTEKGWRAFERGVNYSAFLLRTR